jgi:hypothetical protein
MSNKLLRISVLTAVAALVIFTIASSSVGIAQPTVVDSAATTEDISITVEDSSNGQDNATVPVIVSSDSTSSEVPSWVGNAAITEKQYRAFDTNDNGDLVGDEVRSGVESYINSLPNGEVDGVSFVGDDIRALVDGYINTL